MPLGKNGDQMHVKEDIRNARKEMKNAPLNKKLEYFWDYHKWHVVAAVAVLAIILSFVIPAVTAKKTVLSGALLNCYQVSMDAGAEKLPQALLEALGEDPEKCTVELNFGLVFDPENEEAAQLNYQSVQAIGAQVTLGELDFLVGNLEAMEAFAESGTFYALAEVFPDGDSGEYFVDVSTCPLLAECYPYLTEPLVLGIPVNATNIDRIPALLEYLLP